MPPLSDDASNRRATDGDDPTRADFARLAAVVEKLTATIEAMPDRMERIYLRQDVYHAEQQIVTKNLSTLNTVMRTVASVVGTMILVALMGLILIQG